MYYCRLGVIYDSQTTNRSVPGDMGDLAVSPACILLVAWESYMTPSRRAMHFFVAIRIRVNILLLGEKIAGSGGFFILFVDISHHRYKLRRDVEQTPSFNIFYKWSGAPVTACH